jgi:hypothetical protein
MQAGVKNACEKAHYVNMEEPTLFLEEPTLFLSDVPSVQFSTDREWIESCDMSEEGGRLSAWFPGARDCGVREDVVGLGSYGRLLTVLLTDECDSEAKDDSEVEDDYIDRWKQGIFRPKR